MSETGRASVSERIASQKKWIEEHGGDLNGYFKYFGETSKASVNEIADMFRADLEVLAELEALLKQEASPR